MSYRPFRRKGEKSLSLSLCLKTKPYICLEEPLFSSRDPKMLGTSHSFTEIQNSGTLPFTEVLYLLFEETETVGILHSFTETRVISCIRDKRFRTDGKFVGN